MAMSCSDTSCTVTCTCGPYVRFFGQFESSLEEGRAGGPRPTDEDRLEVNQVFADVVAGLGASESLTLRVGRQELAYGSQRLVSVRESPNVRQAFDALRVILVGWDWRVDGFVSRPVQAEPGVFDDARDPRAPFGASTRRAARQPFRRGASISTTSVCTTTVRSFDQGTAGSSGTRSAPDSGAVPTDGTTTSS